MLQPKIIIIIIVNFKEIIKKYQRTAINLIPKDLAKLIIIIINNFINLKDSNQLTINQLSYNNQIIFKQYNYNKHTNQTIILIIEIDHQ